MAEESARVTSVTSTNLNFKNEEGSAMMNPHSQHGLSHGILQNIGGIPHPQFGSHGFHHVDFNGIGNNNSMIMEQQRPSLSLWLNQGNHEMGQSSNSLFGSSGLSEIVQMGNATTTNNNNALICSSSSSMFGVPASNSTSAANLSLSKPASSGTVSVSVSATPMSATALLQKAAQMGSTRSNTSNDNNNPSIFSSSFGVMTSPSSSTSSAMMGNSSAGAAANANYSSNSSFDQFFMHGPQSNQQGKLNIMHHGGSGSNSVDQVQHSNLTRDFLGVSGGGRTGPPQFLPQEMVKFASSIQFTGNQ